jgi:hypothetical protein
VSDRLRPPEHETFRGAPDKPPAALLRLLGEVLADPSPCDSYEQFVRYNHDDLPGLDLDEIDRERFRLRIGWAFTGLTDWGAQRLAVLDREAERRRRRPRR